MSEKMCPLIGYKCMRFECEFYETELVTEPTCLYRASLIHLNELAHNARITSNSVEQSRELAVQNIRSQAKGEPTDELLTLTGLKRAPQIATG